MKTLWGLAKLLAACVLLVVMPVQDLVARDILRPNPPAPSSSPSTPTGNTPAVGTPAITPRPGDRLSRTAQALQAVQALQAAARVLATQGGGNVPNGLVAGGLQVDPLVAGNPALWTGASLPEQTVAGGQTKVTIEQTAPQAMLNWSSFNIGKQTTLNIDQSLGGVDQKKWIAFNKVNDPSGLPSQILGQIQALGQVYVINANGIIFGGSAQVNVNTLVASALPINDNLINRGLLNNPDTQFLFSSLALPAGANGTPAFTPPPAYTPDGLPGDVEVQAGAKITTPTTADHVGGRVFLFGANVKNSGEISTPDGQTILAAGQQVGLAAHPTTDPSLRGLDVFVGAVGNPQTAGKVTNDGLIEVPRGNITLAGATVNQLGFLDSSTSVALNGRIDLLASYNAVGSSGFANLPAFFPTATGVLTLGPNSVTQILPELASVETVVGTRLALPSQINLQGRAVYFAPDSLVLAPNANVAVNAGVWKLVGLGNQTAVDTFVNASGTGRIYFDVGAMIDVGGTEDIAVPVSENIVAVQLTAAALANSPLLRDGPLRGKTIYVDVGDTGTYNGQAWVGTPLADAAGYANLIQRSVGELTVAGGSVKLSAGESVVMQPGSAVNVSGGWIDYQGGVVPVTRLSAAGKTFLTAKATPDRVYEGVVTSSEFVEGYIHGANGGGISITAPAMALDGNLSGNTISGPRQQQQPPAPSSLALRFLAQDINTPFFYPVSPTPPAITFQANSTLPPADPFVLDAPLRLDRKTDVILSPSLIGQTGFGSFSIENSDGSITVPAQIDLKTVAGGSINFSAANMDLEGSLVAPGGKLQFKVYDFSPYVDLSTVFSTPLPDATRGHFTLGSTGRLDVEGTIALNFTADLVPVHLNGGSISIKSYSADLALGSTMNASGGVDTSGTGKRTYGAGGSIAISVGQDPNIAALIGGQLTLHADLQAYSGGKGGSLSILAPAIQIGGTTVNPDTLLFSPDYFSVGGFSSFTLNALEGLTIAPNTVIAPKVQSLLAVVNPNGVATLERYLQADGLRPPVSLAFGAIGVRDPFSPNPLPVFRGDLVMGAGAVIRTDPLGSVRLSGDTVAVLGSIFAPGGAITIAGAANSSGLFANQQQALPTVDLGPQSVLSAAGTTLLTPNPQNYRTGTVLAGGKITVSGNIVAEAGAVLDVAGASDLLDVAPGYIGSAALWRTPTSGAVLVPTRIDSDGGAIVLAGGQELISAATLKGSAGGSTANGGSLTVSSGRFYLPGFPNSAKTPLDITLAVSQHDLVLSPFYPVGETAIGHLVLDNNSQAIAGYGHFSADSFQAGGFDSLNLRGTVQFSGPVTIAAKRMISLADGGVISADATVRLSAPYLVLGKPFQAPQEASQLETPYQDGDKRPFLFSPTYGAGKLTLEVTSLMDVGFLSLQNIGLANFYANGGDIRGDGTLEMAGNLTLRASQIYPPTAVNFTVAAFDYTLNNTPQLGSVNIEASLTHSLPLSAGGTLSIYASTINQNGILRAPLGTIQLGWDGTGTGPRDLISGKTFAAAKELTLGNNSVTSVSAIDPISGKAVVVPYGLELNGSTWIDPRGVDITGSGVPPKSVQLSSASVVVNPNATIEISGGGDLLAYQWVRGNGGSVDILASASSFAVIPTYRANYAPYGPYNPNPLIPGVFGSDAGYVNNGLSVGDQIYLDASSGLAAGNYTLLPARYALLPGAFLVTPLTGIPLGTTSVLPDGSSLVSGYRLNNLNAARSGQPLTARFEVAPSAVVKSRAEYTSFLANDTLTKAAASRGFVPARLPMDAGQLVFSATQAMALNGKVRADAGAGGLGGLVDISSPIDIVVAGAGAPSQPGVLVLNATELSSFNAGSLLIGGIHQTDATGTKVIVQTGNVTVDNAGAPLTGPDVILVAKQQLTLAPGADIEVAGTLAGKAEPIVLGDSNQAGSGNGVILRVSADAAGTVNRLGVDATTQPVLAIGAGAKLKGPNVIIDSTGDTTLDSAAILQGTAVSIASGQISLALTDPGDLQSVGGLILSGTALESLQNSANALSLLSYSSLDTYGTGQIGQDTLANLAIHAGEIRGFNQGAGTVRFVAQNILLDNSANGTAPGPVNAGSGTLALNADVISLGVNQYQVDQFTELALNAAQGIRMQETGGLTTPGNLTLLTPVIVGVTAAAQTIHAGGDITVAAPASFGPALAPGLGGQFTLVGASITDNSKILLPSGVVRLEATSGDVTIGNTSASQIDVGGVAKTFFDQVRYTDGGRVSLNANLGSVVLAAGSTVNVAAPTPAGNAGSVAIGTPNGSFTLNGTLLGTGGATGSGGTFQLDVGTLPDPSLAALNAALNLSGFTESRSIRVRNGDMQLDGLATARSFDLSADNGSIFVTGTINASGERGGKISLAAGGNLVLEAGAQLSVAGQKFDSAGKGGSVFLAAGQSLDLQTGSTIDLSVAANAGGTLQLRAPQTADNLDLQINPLNGAIINPSRIVVEGYTVFAPGSGIIDDTVRADVFNNGTTFAGNSAAMASRLLANNAGLAPVLVVRPGAEIINASGDLTLDTTWDLSTFRFGPQNQPGVLTLRAAGNLNFDYNATLKQFASLSDGFDNSADKLWTAPLLPEGSESWSYRLVAGADLGAANPFQVQSLNQLAPNTGSLLLGNNAQLKGQILNSTQTAQNIIPNFFQTIRTGTGDIDIYAGRDIQLLSPLATIYTAGTLAAPLANFDLPVVTYPTGTALGSRQYSTPYPAQYSYGGGNVTLVAQNDIARYQVNYLGQLSPDSSKEMPSNWLYRRGYVDPATGQFGITHNGGEVASTSWWIDFTHFFMDVGALGGGNVTLAAGRDVSNVDAVIPTNARMPKGTPDASSLVELGGGDLQVRAGRDINGGVYYVERGQGTLSAGLTLRTNPTRAALDQTTLDTLRINNTVPDSTTWLPTTLFLGKGSFDIFAQGDILLGPVANPFLLPQGINNGLYEKSYFSTYAASDAVNVSSLTGNITLKDNANPVSGGSAGSLASWYQNVFLYTENPDSAASKSQPWLRLAETKTTITAFDTVFPLMPATLRLTAFSGDLNVVGGVTLSPSPTGTLDLLAAKSINGLQPNGLDAGKYQWGSSQINLSDADPQRVPGIIAPLSLAYLGASADIFAELAAWSNPSFDMISGVFLNTKNLFNESGSSAGAFGVLQTQLALHAPGPLHAGDSDPVRLYANSGDISGITLFAGKSTRAVAGQDITDVALYLQNVAANDVSVVRAGRDIIAYDPNSQLRATAQTGQNALFLSQYGFPVAGDIQINGPGTLEVFAGRNLTLGIGPNASDGTAVGITSVGNARNPGLPFGGADVIAAAGLGGADIAATHLDSFYLALRDAGRDHNNPDKPGFGNYDTGFAAIDALFPETTPWQGAIDLTSREIKTLSGGDISLLVPGGQLLVGIDLSGNQPVDQGILTESGGNISIFARDSVIVGTSRIFTLRGGSVMIWSSEGDIAAGASSKTVQSAPPTRVLIDPQSGDVKTDLAGLATGGGIGVLTSVAGVAPGDVDLIAPVGSIDAGDAGIRVSGNINLAAAQVLNVGNISASGASAGVPVTSVSLNASGLQAANATAAATSSGTGDVTGQSQESGIAQEQLPSLISVEVLGYGGGDDESDDDKKHDQGAVMDGGATG